MFVFAKCELHLKHASLRADLIVQEAHAELPGAACPLQPLEAEMPKTIRSPFDEADFDNGFGSGK